MLFTFILYNKKQILLRTKPLYQYIPEKLSTINYQFENKIQHNQQLKFIHTLSGRRGRRPLHHILNSLTTTHISLLKKQLKYHINFAVTRSLKAELEIVKQSFTMSSNATRKELVFFAITLIYKNNKTYNFKNT